MLDMVEVAYRNSDRLYANRRLESDLRKTLGLWYEKVWTEVRNGGSGNIQGGENGNAMVIG